MNKQPCARDYRGPLVASLMLTGLLVATQAHAGGHQPVSSDGNGLEGYVYTAEPVFEVAGEAAFELAAGPSAGDPVSGDGAADGAVLGSEAFTGSETVSEIDLMIEGAELAGIDGEVDDRELRYLRSLPEVSAEEDGGQEVIIGPDTRVRLYTTNYPARAVVLVSFSGGRCSGFMIGPDTVATAGHCVHSGAGGSWHSGVRVYPGYDRSTAPFGACTARRLYSTTGWVRSSNEEYDYGAIKLNCTVGYTVGWFGFRSNAGSNTPAIITGYPGDKSLEMWESSDKVRTDSTRQLFYTNDTIGGMSGSAVWEDWWSGNLSRGAYAIGVHAYRTHGSGSHALYNHGTRINSEVFNNLLSWKNAS